MYEFAMGNVGSGWGDVGEYDKADYYDEIILEGCLRFRRMVSIHRCFYDRWWNDYMRRKKGIPVDKKQDDDAELTRCIQFSNMAGDNNSEQFYCQKLEQMKKE